MKQKKGQKFHQNPGAVDESGEGAVRGMSDWVRKAVQNGIGAFLINEEGLRSTVADLKLPKNAIASLIAQAEKTKAEMVKSVAKEVRLFLDGLQVDELVKKVLSGTAVEIKAQIRLVPQKEEAKERKATQPKTKKNQEE